MHDPLPVILAGTLGAGAMLVIQPLPQPPSCEPVELVRFVGEKPEIHVVRTTDFGRSTDDWLQQYAEAETEREPDTIVRRRRRHGR